MPKRLLVYLSILAVIAGCTSMSSPFKPTPAATQNAAPIKDDPQEVQNANMSFAERYVTGVADIYDQVAQNVTRPEAREMALRSKILAATGALGNAVDPNPLVGLMDMAVMVTLTRKSHEDPWATEVFGAENVKAILAGLTAQEADIWNIASGYITPEQISELRQVIERWRVEHPGQRYVGGARLADFPEAKATAANNAGAKLANSIFGIIRLDPFTGLDPAVRQVEESRILAERMFFYLQHMPTVIAWQTDMITFQMFNQPQITQLLGSTSTVAGSTTRFTDDTSRFNDICKQFADTIERFRQQLPDQQATLVKQLNELVATQREGALQQATTQVSTQLDTSIKQLNDVVAAQRDAALKQANTQIAGQRDAAIEQLNAAVSTQQAAISRNLQGILDSSIDRLYGRARDLILLAAGALITLLVLYRLITTFLLPRKHP